MAAPENFQYQQEREASRSMKYQTESERRAAGVCIACEGPKIRWGEYDHRPGCPLAKFGKAVAIGGEYDDSEPEA